MVSGAVDQGDAVLSAAVNHQAGRFLLLVLPDQFATRQPVMRTLRRHCFQCQGNVRVSRHGAQAGIGFEAVDPDCTGVKVWLAIGVPLLRLRQAIQGKENTNFVARVKSLSRSLWTRTVGVWGWELEISGYPISLHSDTPLSCLSEAKHISGLHRATLDEA